MLHNARLPPAVILFETPRFADGAFRVLVMPSASRAVIFGSCGTLMQRPLNPIPGRAARLQNSYAAIGVLGALLRFIGGAAGI
jgi:hypothetical protein